MHVVVTGATGNVGSRVLPHLLADPAVTGVTGLCRRPPGAGDPRVRWVAADLGAQASAEVLREAFTGADVVVHLAWRIQPSHDLATMRAVNIGGTRRVLDAVLAAGVPAVVHASSVGAYSPAPKDRRTDESWPTGGVETSAYSRQKAEVEAMLDELEEAYPQLRVVRLRPGLIFQRQAASEIARYFIGPLVPRSLVRRALLPAVPRVPGLRFQAVHADDVGRAYALAATRPVHGAFNIAAEPVLDPDRLGAALRARPVPVPVTVLRMLLHVTWLLRLQPTSAGWLDLARSAPLMSTRRAAEELGWQPRTEATAALVELVEGIQHGRGGGTPVLAPAPPAPRRLLTAVRTMLTGGAG